MTELRRFWLRLGSGPSRLGFGVTAYDERDAKDLLQRLVFPLAVLPPVVECIADIRIPDLDPGRIIPKMSPPNWRGVWFPMGYS